MTTITFCGNCGAQAIHEKDRFCRGCGARLVPTASEPSAEQLAKMRSAPLGVSAEERAQAPVPGTTGRPRNGGNVAWGVLWGFVWIPSIVVMMLAMRPGPKREDRVFGYWLGTAAGIVLAVVIVVLAAAATSSGTQAGAQGKTSAAPVLASQTPTFDQARASQLEALLQKNPANKDALFEIGEMNFQAERWEDAISWFTKLVAVDPTNTHVLTDLGTANFNLQLPDKAKEWWQKTLEVDANDIQAHYNLGFMFANTEPRDLAAAVTEWETVLRIDPQSQLAQAARAHIDGLKVPTPQP